MSIRGVLLFVPYDTVQTVQVGCKFKTNFFKNLKHNHPGKDFPGFSIDLPDDYKEIFYNSRSHRHNKLEKLWKENDPRYKIKVQYIYNHGKLHFWITLALPTGFPAQNCKEVLEMVQKQS